MKALSITSNCVAPVSGRGSRGSREHWFRRKRLGWSDGYCILLRIETRFWDAGERIPDAQHVLDFCRRAVLVEMGYRVA